MSRPQNAGALTPEQERALVAHCKEAGEDPASYTIRVWGEGVYADMAGTRYGTLVWTANGWVPL